MDIFARDLIGASAPVCARTGSSGTSPGAASSSTPWGGGWTTSLPHCGAVPCARRREKVSHSDDYILRNVKMRMAKKKGSENNCKNGDFTTENLNCWSPMLFVRTGVDALADGHGGAAGPPTPFCKFSCALPTFDANFHPSCNVSPRDQAIYAERFGSFDLLNEQTEFDCVRGTFWKLEVWKF